MKKVGIITPCSNNNIGNKLQNYALLSIIQSLNFECNTIWIVNPFKNTPTKQFLKMIKKNCIDFFHKRNRKFKNFTKKYLNIYSRKIIYNEDIYKIEKNFDFLIVGSDQVWNYKFVGNENIFLLKNINSEKKISYAASFGVDELEEGIKEIYRQCLKDFSCISVREKRGKELVEELIGKKKIEVVIDPTMLLTTDDWDKLLKKTTFSLPKKYILNYFLGSLSDEKRKEIENFAKLHNCEIINLLDKNDPFYECDPTEFLRLEKNAFLVCTDSFHASVFSILYSRPFVVFKREQKNLKNMSSRIDTLIETFHLKNIIYQGDLSKVDLSPDYTEAYKILKTEREKALHFLKSAFNIEDSEINE